MSELRKRKGREPIIRGERHRTLGNVEIVLLEPIGKDFIKCLNPSGMIEIVARSQLFWKDEQRSAADK